MPNELIRPKGPYELTMRRRRVEERRKKKNLSEDKRTFVLRPKFSILRLIRIIGLYSALYVCIGILLTLNILIIYNLRVHKDRPFELKTTSLSSIPGNYVGNIKIIRYQADCRKEDAPHISTLYKAISQYGHEAFQHLRECNLDDNWGYNTGQPSIILKLNYAVNFNADTYSTSKALPPAATSELHEYIMELPLGERFNRVWIDCIPINNRTIVKISYIPYRYFNSESLFKKEYIFVYSPSENLTDEKYYENPGYRRLACIKFEDIPLNHDVIIKCTAYAKNIPDSVASVIFVFHVDGFEVLPNPESDYEIIL